MPTRWRLRRSKRPQQRLMVVLQPRHAIRGWDGGVAQGQFQTAAFMAKFAKDKTKPVNVRNNDLPDGFGGHERGVPEPDDDGVWR